MADSPWGFWEFAGKNGLTGAASTFETLPDGRVVLQKDPNYPAVLEDKFILQILQTSRQSRYDFNRLYPTLDTVSQGRLDDLLAKNPMASRLLFNEQTEADNIQHKDVTSGVRTQMPTPGRTS